MKRTIEPFNGTVHCVRVPDGNIIIRSGGGVLVVGNCHVLCGPNIREWLREEYTGHVIGLTATPQVPYLRDTYHAMVSGPSVETLTAEGWLTPLEVFVGRETADMGGARRYRSGEFADQDADDRIQPIIGSAPEEWLRVCQEQWGEPVPTVVFSPSVAAGAKLTETFNALIEREYMSPNRAVQVSGGDTAQQRRDALAGFKDGAYIVLVNHSVVGRGFDAPFVRCMVDCRPLAASTATMMQQIGRILRPERGRREDGETAVYVDLVDNWQRLGPQVRAVMQHGVSWDELPHDPPEPDTPVYDCWSCECGRLVPLMDADCGNEKCGGRRPEPMTTVMQAWKCNARDCGRMNPVDLRVCAGCERRTKSRPDAGAPPKPWECPMCGHANDGQEYKCAVAGCTGEKPERHVTVDGRAEKWVEPKPIGVDTSIDLRVPSTYAWSHIHECAVRQKLRKQKGATALLLSKARKHALVEYRELYGDWPSGDAMPAREPDVDRGFRPGSMEK